jgi:hypothetical protein
MAGYQGTSTRNDMHEALAAMVEAERRDMHVAARGRVISYDPATQTAKVKPLIKQRFGDEVLDAPDLESVPVRQPRGGGLAIHAPIKAGDEVDLHFASRSLDDYQTDGESIDGAPARMNNLSDAFAVPAGSSDKTKLTNMPADKFHLGKEDGSAGLQIDPATGKFDFVNGGDSILAVMKDFLTLFKAHTNLGAPLDQIAAADALLSRLDNLKLP